MRNTFGSNITITLFGESHGEAVGCVLDGIAPGIEVNEEYVAAQMQKRKAVGNISTPRKESDTVEIMSGVKNGFTEGTPILLLIRNTNKKSSSYSALEDTPRPSHADYTAEMKYHGYQDKSGGGHFSGRLTAPIVAAGAIIGYALKKKGIEIGTHIKELHGIRDRAFENLSEDIALLDGKEFPVLDESATRKMTDEILAAASEGDSVGGVLECAVTGVACGVGEPWFDTVEGMLAKAMLSIPGVKGIEFGLGFEFAKKYGSEANDAFAFAEDKVVTLTNNNGGINGGITNGMPIIFSLAVKPTPSIFKEQSSVDLKTGENKKIKIEGRHDPAIIHRARAVVDAMCAITIADLLVTRFGTDYLA